MPFEFPFRLKSRPRVPLTEPLPLRDRLLPLAFVRNARARRYVLRLRPDGSARVTVPRGGSFAEARRFAERSREWLERQLGKQAAQPRAPSGWFAGDPVLCHGEPVRLDRVGNSIRFGDEILTVRDPAGDCRPELEAHLWRLAARELPARVWEFAHQLGLPVQRVQVRNQRSRWGSCSRRGTISLNWRLIQTPAAVRDYIVLHELMHLRHMNHSHRFWREVESVCPGWREAERWLKQHSGLLRRPA